MYAVTQEPCIDIMKNLLFTLTVLLGIVSCSGGGRPFELKRVFDVDEIIDDSVEVRGASQGFAVYEDYGFFFHDKGQVLITIPEMSNLVVDFDLPEQYRSKINIGDRAVISPDSLPGEKFGGAISHIDTLPVNLVNWDASSPKIYKSKIKLDQQSPKLVNGMSVQINIVTKTIPNTIFVPVEAVFEDNDRFFVYRSSLTGPKEADVTIGESNDNFVQITSGLEEGDVVYLYRPYQKTQDSQ